MIWTADQKADYYLSGLNNQLAITNNLDIVQLPYTYLVHTGKPNGTIYMHQQYYKDSNTADSQRDIAATYDTIPCSIANVSAGQWQHTQSIVKYVQVHVDSCYPLCCTPALVTL